MQEATTKWSEDEVVEAFIHFRNPQIEVDRQEIERLLRECLKGFDENEFDSGHIMSVALLSVPLKSVSEFVAVMVRWLEEQFPDQ